MSLFSFIAFPREVNMSCVKSMIDPSKESKVKDLKGTQWEKDYIGIPDDQEVYLGDPEDFHELQVYEKYSMVSFRRVFKNAFIYSMDAMFNISTRPDLNACIEKILDEIEKQDGIRISGGEFIKNFEKYGFAIKQQGMKYIARCRRQLYELIKNNTDPGETVEIFSHWISGSDYVKLGPQKETRVLDVEEALTSELLDTANKIKIEIRNTK